jgi:hypothetical protein
MHRGQREKDLLELILRDDSLRLYFIFVIFSHGGKDT